MSSLENLSDPPRPNATLEGLELLDVEFHRYNDWPTDGGEQSYKSTFTLGASSIQEGQLGVELGIRISEPELFDLEIRYRATFAAVTPISDDVADEFWRGVATRLAPVVIFPYVRESASAILGRSGNSGFHLPILNVGLMFDPAKVRFEDADEEPGVQE
jgi:hypothetical protein